MLEQQLASATEDAHFHAAWRNAVISFDLISSPHQTDCREGCSLCCWLRVDTWAHEVFFLAQALEPMPRDQKDALLQRLQTHATTVTQLTVFEHATRNIACPLLVDGRCSAYAARPQACRRHHSTDLNACIHTFENPTDLQAPAGHDAAIFGLCTERMTETHDIYCKLGYDPTIYELGSALWEALTDSACWQRWRAREKAFLRASHTPTH